MCKSLRDPASKTDDWTRQWQKRIWRKPGHFVPLVLVLVVTSIAISSWQPAYARQTASTCTPNAILVNPCRPWFGAAAEGNPGAPSDPISQGTYLEQLVGQQLDIFRFYHKPGNLPLAQNDQTGKAENYFVNRANTYIQVNWKPATTWAAAGGSDATVNAQIKQAAMNIAAVAPHKVLLTIWHEPENDVSAFDNSAEQTVCKSDPNFKGLKGSAGTPNQYKAMWQNVQNIFENVFQQEHVANNVVWAMDYMSYPPFYCLIPYLWPGNQAVNWVLYDTYANGNKGFADTAGAFYNVLQQDSSPSVDLNSKPWGLGEFNDCNPKNPQDAVTYFQDAEAAFKANTYPRLKMYLVYADTGNNAGPGCLTNYDANGQPFPAKQAAFNQLAQAVLNSGMA